MPWIEAPDPHRLPRKTINRTREELSWPSVHTRFVSRAGTLRDRFPIGWLSAWLNERDLDVYAGEFEPGVTGALNRHRNMDCDWEDLAAFGGVPLAGRRDQGLSGHAAGPGLFLHPRQLQPLDPARTPSRSTDS